MNTPFLMCGYAAALVLMLVGFRGVRRSTPDLHGSRQLTWFLLCALFAVLLIGLHPWVPAFFSEVVSNFLLFAGGIFLYLAASDILERGLHIFPWPTGVLIVALPLFVWFTYGRDSMQARLLLHAVVVSTIFLSTAIILFRKPHDPEIRPPARACAWLLVLASALQGTWCLTVFRASQTPNFTHPDMLNVGFSYLSMILALAIVIGLLWLALTVHRLELNKMAQTDVLTGLLNRRAFEEILRRELLRCQRQSSSMGLLIIDLDYFKQVNDSLGHFAGDDVLRRIAMVLRDGTRPSDVLARYGGEEFVVLLRNTGEQESETAAERIRTQIANLAGLPGSVRLTASIGVAISQPGDIATDFLLRSDEALYHSKRRGRNQVSVYYDSLDEFETPVPVGHS
ncbi:MAG: GGDEF domain-containing protein [Acidobacteriaceae bacterium]